MPVLLSVRSFSFQQLLLPLQSPTITPQALVLANDAVARNHQGDRVRGTGARNRAHRFFLANGSGNFTVGMRLAIRDRSQLLPNLPLKSRSLNIQW